MKHVLKKLLFFYCSWFTMLCWFLLKSKVTQLYTYIHSFLLQFILGAWIGFPVLYSRSLLIIYSKYNTNRLHLLIPNSQSIPLHLPPLPHSHSLIITSQFSRSVSLFLFFRYVHLCHILDSTCKWYCMEFVFLSYFT